MEEVSGLANVKYVSSDDNSLIFSKTDALNQPT